MTCASGKPPSRGRSLIQTTKTKHNPRPSSVLLKDYLRDDLSSCSSSGFKSFPRRQCCTTVGFFPEKDLKRKQKRKKTQLPRRPALQRASEAVINAFKSLPLSNKSSKAKRAATGLLCRSLSRKLLSRSFWRKAAKEDNGSEEAPKWIRKSFRELLMQDKEQYKATSFKEEYTTVYTVPSIITTSSGSGCGSNSWRESEFTFSSTAAASESSTENDPADGTKHRVHHHKIRPLTTTDWTNEKEQFSPVSVLDCPFEDEQEIKSDSNSTTHSIEGDKHKHMQKRRHFECVASLEPLVLEKRIAQSESEDEPNHHSTKQRPEMPIMHTQNENNNVHRDSIENNARDLLNTVKMSIPSKNRSIIETENLLFDYFKQSIEENITIDNLKKVQLCKVAEDWINGKPQELYLGWEVDRGRGVYVKEMDKRVEWKNSTQETKELGIELESEIFTSLLNELIHELAMW